MGFRKNGRNERALVIAAKSGDDAARCELVQSFTPLVASVARTYQNSAAVERRELMQEGVVGILRALRGYDPELETPFWAYATWWVRQAMQQLVAEMTRPIVLSDRALRQLARVKRAQRRHLQSEGREPSTAELATAAELPRERVESLRAAERPPRSLQERLGGDETAGDSVGDMVADPGGEDDLGRIAEQIEAEPLRELLETLDHRERGVVSAHYGVGRSPQTLREIGCNLDLSAERVRQIEERALEKMRRAATVMQ